MFSVQHFVVLSVIFASFYSDCQARCYNLEDPYDYYCDDDFKLAVGIIYALAIGIPVLICVGIALCCVCCACCPFYRGKRRGAAGQVFVAAPQNIGVNANGVTMGQSYGFVNQYPNHPAYPTQPGVILSPAHPPYPGYQPQYNTARDTMQMGASPPYADSEPSQDTVYIGGGRRK